MNNELRKELKAYFSVYCEDHTYFKVKSYISDFLIKHLGYNPKTKMYLDVKAILKQGLSMFVKNLKDRGLIEAYNNSSYRIIKNLSYQK